MSFLEKSRNLRGWERVRSIKEVLRFIGTNAEKCEIQLNEVIYITTLII